jgi:hypothetical protein
MMTTITGTSVPANRTSLLRSIAVSGITLFVLQTVIQEWLVYTVIQKNPATVVWQYIASGAVGNAAFTGGTATALLGVLFHLLISLAIAAVFLLGADRIPVLRRYAIAAALLYGFGVWIVMNFIVIPLSAAPPLPAPTTPWLLENILEHMLVVGLPLGIAVRRNARV